MKKSILLKQLSGYPTTFTDINNNNILVDDKIILYYNIFDSNICNKERDIGYGIIKYDKNLDLFYIKLLQSIVIGSKVYTAKDNIYLYDKDKALPKSTLIAIQPNKYIEINEHKEENMYKICNSIYDSEYEDDFYLYLKKLIDDKIISLPTKSRGDEIIDRLRQMMKNIKTDNNEIQILGEL